MTGWSIRPARPGDEAALSLVACAAFLETYGAVLDGSDILAHCGEKLSAGAFAAAVADDRAIVLVAETPAAAPLGYALLRPSALAMAGPGDLELLRLYVLAPRHGGGLGPALMTAACDAARASGARRLLLGVYHGNARARRFYERCGFEVVGERPFTVGAVTHLDPVYALVL